MACVKKELIPHSSLLFCGGSVDCCIMTSQIHIVTTFSPILLRMFLNWTRTFFRLRQVDHHFLSVKIHSVITNSTFTYTLWATCSFGTGLLRSQHILYMAIFQQHMMTSSNGNIFRVTGHLCGEFTGPRWIPRTKASEAELWCFLWSASE